MNIKLMIVRWMNKHIIKAELQERIFTEKLVRRPLEYYIEVSE